MLWNKPNGTLINYPKNTKIVTSEKNSNDVSSRCLIKHLQLVIFDLKQVILKKSSFIERNSSYIKTLTNLSFFFINLELSRIKVKKMYIYGVFGKFHQLNFVVDPCCQLITWREVEGKH